MKIQKSDLIQISYNEFLLLLDKLTLDSDNYFTTNNEQIDLIVPIIRSGMITGMHIDSKLKITNILPAQYKYEYVPVEKLVKKFEFPKLNFEVPSRANILIVDSNTVFGGTACKVIEDVYKQYPTATLYFASANLDQSIAKLEYIEKIFFGQLSNEKRLLTQEEASEKDIDNRVIIFPWENLEEQWSEINASQEQI